MKVNGENKKLLSFWSGQIFFLFIYLVFFKIDILSIGPSDNLVQVPEFAAATPQMSGWLNIYHIPTSEIMGKPASLKNLLKISNLKNVSSCESKLPGTEAMGNPARRTPPKKHLYHF